MLFRMVYSVYKVKIFRQRRYVKLGGDLVDALMTLVCWLALLFLVEMMFLDY